MILFVLSFIAGILTVLAPCTLALLPVIVGSSVTGTPSLRRSIVITSSLGFSIILFTFLLKVSSVFINIPQEVWSIIAGFIIIIFGILSVVPEIWEDLSFVAKLNVSSNKLLGVGFRKENFWGDVIIGVALGPVFSSCSPTYFLILASVLPQSLVLGLIDLIAYAVGLSVTLLAIAFLGQRFIARFSSLSDTHGWFRRSLGFLFIIIGICIVLGFDKKIQAGLLNGGFFDVTRFEQSLLKLNEKGDSLNTNSYQESINNPGDPRDVQRLRGPKAREIVNPSGFINTDGKPITIAEFKGKKVILLDIWTYSCINCQRTLPYIKSWYEKYKDQGLIVIGIHTPEFAFEKVKENVEEAVKKFGITYPVVMDNSYSTWTAYGNQYWPRKYLINGDGEIVYDHIGEGNYEETEKAIQRALSDLNGKEMGDSVTSPPDVISVDPNKVFSPEIYFGASRNEYLANGRLGATGQQTLSLPKILNNNSLYLEGTWDFYPEHAVSKTHGKIIFKYNAKNVYMVANGGEGLNVVILKDGKKQKDIFVKANELYSLIEGIEYGVHTLEIDVPPGLEVFTLTFG